MKLNINDLDFILRQIKLAEAHTAAINAGGDPRASLETLVGTAGGAGANPTQAALMPFGLRTVDGSYNNFQPNMTHFGSADQPMIRMLEPYLADAEANPRNNQPTSYTQLSGSVYDSQPRVISNLIADQTLDNPAAVAGALASVGITGAPALAIVQQVMQLQEAVKTAQAAVATAAQQAATARAAAQADVVAKQAALASAEQVLATATTAVTAAQAALSAAGTILQDAEQARDANLQQLSVAQQDAAAKSTLAAAAQVEADARQAAETLAFANRAAAEAGRAEALSAFTATPNAATSAAFLAADTAFVEAAAIYTLAAQADDLADAALVAAQAEHGAAVAALQLELTEQAAADSAVESAETGLAAAQSALASANAGQAVATANVAAAQQALATADAGLAALPADDAAATAAAEAVVAAAEAAVLAEVTSHGIAMDGDNVFIRNVAADLGDTASFNGFMTIFGQFFDHGLDLTTKGGAGSVYIPLHPDDPLYVAGSPTNFMVLTRATNVSVAPGADGIAGTADDVRSHTNETTPWIDLNQVYTSNPSHQVFLREYTLVDGKPVATGHMLESATGGPPSWADIKAQARDVLGINLSDLNVYNVPSLLTDLYGEFVRGANGLPILMTPSGALQGNLNAPVDALQAVPAGRAFLNDIAHDAAPGEYVASRDMMTGQAVYAQKAADADTATGNPAPGPNMFGGVATYDNELLDRHFIVGDGRGNENIALTSTHAIFHSEHNRQVDTIKQTLLANGSAAVLNEWLSIDVDATLSAAQVAALNPATLSWDGERLFQAARFSTEMVYQHLVFEEFVRAVAPQIDPFVFSNSVEVNGAIFEEFAQVVYRFGHSMLNEKVEILNFSGGAATAADQELFDAFLNPVMFDQIGAGSAEVAAGAILRGMTRQAGNEIDEFMTDALRNNLVGLPLDLAALNIARARETGVPSLNETRRQIFEQTNDTLLKPYESWTDFALHLKNPLSIVNFIAAYGTHGSILAATTAEAKRDAAWALVFGGAGAPADRLDFLNATGAWAGGPLGGLEKVDFWIGGLAEQLMPFGGMLGSTFAFIFELQIQNLQNGDRFYYLSRTQGQNMLTELESDSFADLIRRNTDTEESGLHINGAAFQTADYIIEMNQARQYNAGLGNADPSREADVLSAITGQSSLVIRKDLDADGDGDYIRYTGGEHVVLGGTGEDDIIIGGQGDDTLWGEAGDDTLEGGFGVDHIHGGDGDDIITDSGTDIGAADVLKGEAGDDVINGGMGLDLIFGGEGKDVLTGGQDAKSLFGGAGDDFIRAPTGGGGVIYGNEGDDWLEAQGNMTTLTGDNSELFFNSRIIGHDVMLAGENDTDFDAESGDDIMVQGIGINRNNGMAGFDWATHKGNSQGADADMNVSIFTNQQANILRDRFDLVEGLSGWQHDDRLTGRDVVTGAYDANGSAAQIDPTAPFDSYSNALLAKNVGLVDGLSTLVGHLTPTLQRDASGTVLKDAAGQDALVVMDTADGSDMLLGGGGSDRIEGRAGNDIIDGDRWLDVRIGFSHDGVAYTTDGIAEQVWKLSDYVGGAVAPGAVPAFQGQTLEQLLFSRTVKPGDIDMVREIVNGGRTGDIDTAVFWDDFANYDVVRNADGSITVTHVTVSDVIDPASGRARVSDGVDRLFNIEKLSFAGEVFDVGALVPSPATGLPIVVDPTPTNGLASPTEGQTLSVDTSGIADANGLGAFSYQWQVSTNNGQSWSNIGGATSSSFTPNDGVLGFGGQVGDILRVGVSFTDGGGTLETVYSVPTTVVGNDWNGVTLVNNTFNGTEGDDIADGVNPVNFFGARGGNDTLNGNGGNDILNGLGGNDAINGGAGNDRIDAGAGTDTITQAAVDGRDLIDGGTGTDTYVLTGTANLAETFRIYAVTAGQNAGLAASLGTSFAAATEIVITRRVGTGPEIAIAELDNIEEIRVSTLDVTANDGGGLNQGSLNGDLIQVVGNFNSTSLNFSTITIDGSAGDDQIDITMLESAHRIVFRSNGGNDTIVGTLRPQDVILLPEGTALETVSMSDNDNGTVTLGYGAQTITFAADGVPEVRVAQPGEDLGHGQDDDHDDDAEDADDNDTDGVGDGDGEDDGDGDSDGEDCGCDGDGDGAGTPVPPPATGTGGLRTGTVLADVLVGTAVADNIVALAGDDVLIGEGGDDVLSAGEGADFADAGEGRDVVFAGAGDDQVFAGGGNDMVYGEAGADRLFGGAGNDLIDAGSGDDTVVAGSGDDLIVGAKNDGDDSYFGDEMDGGTGIDTLDLSVITAHLTVDLGNGLGGRGSAVSGQSGTDTLWGIENVATGSGNDTITASVAVNVMEGGAGTDTFRFLSKEAADGDTILDFEPGDRLDLSGIDADAGVAGNQAFTLLASGQEFSTAAQLSVTYETRADGDYTVVSGNVGGTPDAEFQINLKGSHALTGSSFTL